MAVAFRSASSASSSGAVSSFNCPTPAGVAAGDVLVMVCHSWASAGGGQVPSATGWTRHAQHQGGSGATGDNFAVFSRVADGSEGANVTVTFTANSFANVGIVAYSGASSVDAFADSGSMQAATTTPTVPSVTTTAANDIVVGIAEWITGNSGTQASGWTERLDHTSAASGSLIYAMEKAQASAGASPTAQPTGDTSAQSWTFAVAVKAPAVVTPVADFTGTPLTGVTPLSVTFTDTSTNTPTSWAWTFGDGGTSTSQNPSHSYTSAGTYTVVLVATNAGGSNTKTRTGYVTVTAAFLPQITMVN